MEVNPRFQGSIECVDFATRINQVKLHIDAFEGKIHDLPRKPIYKNYAIKGILFTSREESFPVKYYPKSKWIVDRTHYNVILEKGDPFCSIVFPTKSAERGYKKLLSIVNKIMNKNPVTNH